MHAFKEISPKELKDNPFVMIGTDWLLVTAAKGDKVNTMTASWGGVGILWNKPVAFVFIRPQRYTKEFVDDADTLSLSVLNNSFRKTLSYLGIVSGRDEDKIQKAGLTIRYEDNTPFFDEAEKVLLCRKLYRQNLEPACFLEQQIDASVYPEKDYHAMYVCEIEKILTC